MQPSGVRNISGNGVVIYQHAVRRLLEARGRVQRMTQLIVKAAVRLDGDRWRAEAGVQPQTGQPDLRLAGEGRVNLTSLPSGEELLAAMSEWREAWLTLDKAWQVLPPENQVGLKEPKELY